MAEDQKSPGRVIEELQLQLNQQEEEFVLLRDRRNKTIRELRKAKLAVTIPSEAVRKVAQNAGPMDNEFFNKIGEDLKAIEEIISTILNTPVQVTNAVPQYTITNIGSRGVRFDNYAEIIVEAKLLQDCDLGPKGAFVDIEIQKEDKGDHEYRVYYNGASMVINKTPASTDFSNLPRAIVIFISAFDVFGDGELFYENVLVDKKTKKLRRRPVADFYVNTEHIEKGATDEKEEIRKIAALMKVFRDPDWYDEQFPAFSKRKKELHETEKGVEDVSKEIQMIIDEETEKNTEKMKNEFVDRLIALGKNTAEEISSLVGMPIDQVQQKMKRQYA